MSERITILVIDDDPDIHDFCQVALGSAGYSVLLASTGSEGRALMTSEHVDLVVLDIMMEQADAGFFTAQWLARERPDVPVLMLSSIADASDSLFDTSILAVADLVNKPIAPKELIAKVEKLLARRPAKA